MLCNFRVAGGVAAGWVAVGWVTEPEPESVHLPMGPARACSPSHGPNQKFAEHRKTLCTAPVAHRDALPDDLGWQSIETGPVTPSGAH